MDAIHAACNEAANHPRSVPIHIWALQKATCAQTSPVECCGVEHDISCRPSTRVMHAVRNLFSCCLKDPELCLEAFITICEMSYPHLVGTLARRKEQQAACWLMTHHQGALDPISDLSKLKVVFGVAQQIKCQKEISLHIA